MVDRYKAVMINRDMARGRHFFDLGLPWNAGG
jgi:hypothetical protein